MIWQEKQACVYWWCNLARVFERNKKGHQLRATWDQAGTCCNTGRAESIVSFGWVHRPQLWPWMSHRLQQGYCMMDNNLDFVTLWGSLPTARAGSVCRDQYRLISWKINRDLASRYQIVSAFFNNSLITNDALMTWSMFDVQRDGSTGYNHRWLSATIIRNRSQGD